MEAEIVITLQIAITAIAAGTVMYLIVRRSRTASEGREFAVSETLSLVNQTLPYLRRGLSRRTAPEVAAAIHGYLGSSAVGIVSGREILAHVGEGSDHHQAGSEPLTTLARQVVRTGRPTVARTHGAVGCPRPACPLSAAVAAPLTLQGKVVGCLQVYVRFGQPLSASKVKMVTALAQLMSVEMELAELDAKTERLAKAELKVLQAQISPHFIYNTLNAIVAFVRTDPEQARQLLSDFADFLRMTFRRKGEFTPFAEELEYVHQYLSFEKARFGDRLNVVYRVAPEVLSTVVPVLVLQPLVENAVRHGISPKIGEGRVLVAAEDRGNECWICVEDNGVGMPGDVAKALLQKRNGSGVGLRNVNDRLRSVYGPEHGLEIWSQPLGGTRVTFSVPKFKPGVAI